MEIENVNRIYKKIRDIQTYEKWMEILESDMFKTCISGKKYVDTIEEGEKYNDFPNIQVYLKEPIFIRDLEFNEMYKERYPNMYITKIDLKNICIDSVLCSTLSNVHTLTLENVSGYLCSALSNIHTLNIYNSYIDYVPMLKNIHTIHIEDCPTLTEINCMDNLNTLQVENCPKLNRIDTCLKLENCEIYNCPKLTDISGVCDTQKIILWGCHGITDISKITSKWVLLNKCSGVTSVSSLSKANNVSLICCENIKDISSISSVKKLTVRSCNDNVIEFS